MRGITLNYETKEFKRKEGGNNILLNTKKKTIFTQDYSGLMVIDFDVHSVIVNCKF